jgi:hypothetical protein
MRARERGREGGRRERKRMTEGEVGVLSPMRFMVVPSLR